MIAFKISAMRGPMLLMVRVALKMVPTLADVLGIDIHKGLSNYHKTVMPSNVSTSQGTVDWVWAKM